VVFFELFTNDPHIVRIPAGQTLFREGDVGELMYVLVLGKAEIHLHNRLVETMQPGNIVGEMSLVSPGARTATVLAVTNCEFVAVDEKRFLYLIQQTPFFATKVMKVMAERLRATDELVPVNEDI
jgi:CRP/FNR family transcriptional regulator, cyclic AMP receptor protein